MNELTIHLSEVGNTLGTRSLGEKLRSKYLLVLEEKKVNKIYFDFNEVDVITNSFANECFGKLRAELKDDFFNRISFINANDFVRRTLINAM